MNTKLVALALVVVIAVAVIAIYSLNSPLNSGTSSSPTPTPVPTQPPIPSTPTDQNSTVTVWGDFHFTYPTELTIISPQNQTYTTSDLTLQVNITTSFWLVNSVYYQADWLGDYHRIYTLNSSQGEPFPAITLTANFTGIPESNHTIEVIANYHDGSHAYGTVNFSVNYLGAS